MRKGEADYKGLRNTSQTYRSAIHNTNALLEEMFTGERKNNQKTYF